MLRHPLDLYSSGLGLLDISPVVTKVDCYLRMAKLPYERVNLPVAELAQTPKAKLLIIEDQGKTVADSGFIEEYLKATYGDTLDKSLTLRDRAVALALRRMMEEGLYWSAIIQTQWKEEANFALYRPALYTVVDLPPDQRDRAVDQFREGILQEFYGQGMGRHTAEENYGLARADLTALSDYLGERPYFMGQDPTSLDAAVYAWLAHIL